MGGERPASSVVDTVTAACTRVLRSVKLFGDDSPSGITWKHKDPRKEYKFGTELGHGNYGVVHAVTHIQSGRMYACKILRKLLSSVQRQYLLTEVATLKRVCDHPNVATLHEVWEDAGYIYLVMEPCLGGELFDVIIQRGHFTEKDAAVVMKVILDVVKHCHENGVAHRDLKPENFLLKRKALDPNVPLRAEDLRAVDFGLAVFLEPEATLKELLGSPFYVAPELLRGKYGFPADIWSAGVILYILLSGSPPFSGNNEREVFWRVLRQPVDLESGPWPQVSASAKDLVAKLLERDPTKRLTPKQALQHPWLKYAASDSVLQSHLVMERLREFTHMTKLQGILMNLIAKNLSTEGIENLKDAFNSLDQNGDGYLSFEELRQGLEDASAGSEQCSNVAKVVMDALDVSGDGSIEYHEFLAAVVDRQRTLTDQTLAEIFAYLDKNKDGLISPQELSDALAESDINVSQSTLKQLMAREMPGSGPDAEQPMLTEETFAELLRGGLQSKTIQLSQLEEALSDMHQSFRMRNRFRQLALLVIARTTPVSELHGLKELFERLDADNSGCLTLDELRKGLKFIDSQLGDDEIEDLLDFMDVDGSNTIDYHEFVMGVLEDKQLLTEAKLQAAFDYFDTDRNGKIDIGEVEQVVKELGIKMRQSPRELLALADANEDQVVDFTEFREMMLSAEPNILITRQQSLAPRSSGSSTLSSKSSTKSSHGSLEKVLSQPLSLRAELRSPASDLAARQVSRPQADHPPSAASQEELSGASPIVESIAAKLRQVPDEAAQLEKRISEGSLVQLDSLEGAKEELSILFQHRTNSLGFHNPFADFQAAIWDGSCRGSEIENGATPQSKSPLSGGKEGDGVALAYRSTASLPDGAVTRQGLRQFVRQRSRSVNFSDEARNSLHHGIVPAPAPRRGKHMVFPCSLGPSLSSIKPGEMDSVDDIIRRASGNTFPKEGNLTSRLLGASGKSGAQDPPKSILKTSTTAQEPSPVHASLTRIGDVQQTIPEEEVMPVSSQHDGQHGRPGQNSSREAAVELTTMMRLMEDQWSRTSLLARGKQQPRR